MSERSKMRRFYIIVAAFLAIGALFVNNATSRGADDAMRWSLQSDGSIQWSDFSEKSIPHADHIEASGEQVSTVLRYGVDETGAFTLSRSVVWPMLRTIPNNTHASLMRRFDVNLLSYFTVDGAPLSGGKGRKSFPQRISNGSESLFTRQWRRAPSGAKALPLDERALRRRASHSEERV